MKREIMGCVLFVFATVGCGAAESGEDLGESQEALLRDNKVLRLNSSGKCVEYSPTGIVTVNCTYPYPSSKKWDFIGDTTSGFRLMDNSSHCITAPLSPWSGITVQTTTLCGPEARSLWKVRSGGDLNLTFQLYNVEYTSMCLTEDLNQAGQYLRLSTCATSYPAQAKQVMLLDDF